MCVCTYIIYTFLNSAYPRRTCISPSFRTRMYTHTLGISANKYNIITENSIAIINNVILFFVCRKFISHSEDAAWSLFAIVFSQLPPSLRCGIHKNRYSTALFAQSAKHEVARKILVHMYIFIYTHLSIYRYYMPMLCCLF